MKIIVVDDEEILLRSFERTVSSIKDLELVGKFNNAKSALSFLESSECDAAFIDIKMPIVNGVDLAKQIEEKYPDMKIVFITGLGSEDIHQQYEAALERKIILKPIAAEQLQTIANSLNSQEKECW